MENPNSREPCPDCILDATGGAFGMGVIGGSAWYFLKGIYNSPNGTRLLGGAQAVRMNVPRIGGQWAAWGGLYSAIDCTAVYIRQKEDPWNSIISGAATGGLLSLRQGAAAASRSAVMGGFVLAMITGAGMAFSKVQNMAMMQEQMRGMPEMGQMPNQAPESLNQDTTASSSSWLGGLFGKKNDEVKKSSGSITEVLESFDAPPVPSYDYK